MKGVMKMASRKVSRDASNTRDRSN